MENSKNTSESLPKITPQNPPRKELPIDFAPGGQAVLEGVLMRSPN